MFYFKPIPPSLHKRLVGYRVKAQRRSHEGEPCKPGWSAANTGCVPKKGGKKPAPDRSPAVYAGVANLINQKPEEKEWVVTVYENVDEVENNNIADSELSLQEIAAEQNWHSQYIKWRWGISMGGPNPRKKKPQPEPLPAEPEQVGLATRFITGLLNPKMGGNTYIQEITKGNNIPVANVPPELVSKIKTGLDSFNPAGKKTTNLPVAKLTGAVIGESAVPVVNALNGKTAPDEEIPFAEEYNPPSAEEYVPPSANETVKPGRTPTHLETKLGKPSKTSTKVETQLAKQNTSEQTTERSHEGEPCKPGWSQTETGCVPASKVPSNASKIAQDASKLPETGNDLSMLQSQSEAKPEARKTPTRLETQLAEPKTSKTPTHLETQLSPEEAKKTATRLETQLDQLKEPSTPEEQRKRDTILETLAELPEEALSKTVKEEVKKKQQGKPTQLQGDARATVLSPKAGSTVLHDGNRQTKVKVPQVTQFGNPKQTQLAKPDETPKTQLGNPKQTQLRKLPHEGEACQRGWTPERTGCIPARKSGKSEQEQAKISDEVITSVKRMMDGSEEITADKAIALKEQLMKLSGQSISKLKKKLGIKGKKADLAQKIMEGLTNERGTGTEGTGTEAEKAGSGLEEQTTGTAHPPGDPEWQPDLESVGEAVANRIPREIGEVNKKIDKYANLFRKRGQHEQANWMDMLKNHINTVGVESALQSLGSEVTGEGEDVQYTGHFVDIGSFAEKYLSHNGISLVMGNNPNPEQRFVSAAADAATYGDQTNEGILGVRSRGRADDVIPPPQTLRNKLHEAQMLPGLKKSEDIGKLMGQEFGSRVDNFTPEVMAKLDATYGEGGWIVKSYGAEAFAGYGIFFPQRAKQLKQEAQNIIWSAGENIAKHGFEIHRDADGKIIGLKHQGGKVYEFGSDDYNNELFGDVRHWGDVLSQDRITKDGKGNEINVGRPMDSEHGTAIPKGSFMAQPAFPVVGISNEERAAGITFKKGQEGRVHITTKNGKAEIVPHSTWLKEEHLPVVFEDEETLEMAKAALHAINYLPESERQGQLYAPDIVKTADGFRVVEANPSDATGSSGYLQDSPMVIDAYVSHVTGREPGYVSFIRNLLAGKANENSNGKTSRSGRTGSESGSGGVEQNDSGRKGKANSKQPGKPQAPKQARQAMIDSGVGYLPVPTGDEWRWNHPPEVQHQYNEKVLKSAKKAGLFVPANTFAEVTEGHNVGGQEHDVHYDAKGKRYYKFTKGGRFGQNKDVPEYLQRLEIANQLWPSLDYKFHGITQSPFNGTPQAVTSMAPIAGTHPETHEIEDWFKSNGWEPNDERWEWEDGSDAGHWSWRDPKTGTVINDAHTKNFIKTKNNGLVPIDVDILPGKKEKQ